MQQGDGRHRKGPMIRSEAMPTPQSTGVTHTCNIMYKGEHTGECRRDALYGLTAYAQKCVPKRLVGHYGCVPVENTFLQNPTRFSFYALEILQKCVPDRT
jgi:hypothetical protein